MNETYHFHASPSSIAAFWNNTFRIDDEGWEWKISWRQVWQAFIQESIRKVASVYDFNLELDTRLPTKDVAHQAFQQLDCKGVIETAHDHSCSECTHAYEHEADHISGADPAAVIGVDENRRVPRLEGEFEAHAAQDSVNVDGMDVDEVLQQI